MVMLLGKSYSSYPIYYCCCRCVVVSLLVLVLCGVRFYYCLFFYSPVAVFCQSVLLFATSFCLELLHSLSFATWKKSTQSITEAKRHNHLYHHTAVVQFQHRCVCLSRFIINWIINWPLPGMKYEAYSFEIQKQPEMMLTSNKFWLTFLELHNTYCVLLSDRLNRIFNAMACPIPICHMRKKVTIYNNVI